MKGAAGPLDGNSPYTVDLSYPSSFVLAQAPIQLQWAAVTTGVSSSPLSKSFTYCDLGCGDGTTLNVLAAAYPEARFIGIDLNPEHLKLARELAHRAALNNVQYLKASFADLTSLDLPQLDYIAANGVYSWVERELQSAIHSFVQAALNPGGLFSVHYTCLPGCALQDPIYNYLRTSSAQLPGGSRERFTASLRTMHKLVAVSRFFERNSSAVEMLEDAGRYPVNSIAHDVLNRQPHSYYFREIHDALSAMGLVYAGSANLLPNYPELQMSAEAYAVYRDLSADADTCLREETKDLILDTSYRFDLFRMRDGESDKPERPIGIRNLGRLHLHRIGNGEDLDARRRASKACAANLTSDLHSSVLDLLSNRSRTINEVLDSKDLSIFVPADVERAIEQLFATGFLHVLIQPGRRPTCHPGARYRFAHRLNAIALQETILSDGSIAFASPVLGSPIMLPADARVRLLALLKGDLEPVWNDYRRKTRSLAASGNSADSFEQFRASIEASLPAFSRGVVQELVHLGVLEEDRREAA